jgi:hypothetical protein
MYTAYHDVLPMMMLLYLVSVAIFAALKWQGTPTQGKEEGGFGKNDISRFILSRSQELAFHIILASLVLL